MILPRPTLSRHAMLMGLERAGVHRSVAEVGGGSRPCRSTCQFRRRCGNLSAILPGERLANARLNRRNKGQNPSQKAQNPSRCSRPGLRRYPDGASADGTPCDAHRRTHMWSIMTSQSGAEPHGRLTRGSDPLADGAVHGPKPSPTSSAESCPEKSCTNGTKPGVAVSSIKAWSSLAPTPIR